jgi:glycosyltransferase involved in cell wall biosynthesis
MIKVLFVNTWIHHKNLNSLLSYKNIQLETINNVCDIDNRDLSTFDCVYSPTDPIDVSKYPGIVFIFGPHFCVIPNDKLLNINSDKSIYIMPSNWCVEFWRRYDLSKNLNMVSIPFGVDIEKFCEIKRVDERNTVFIYYKSRHPQELQFIEKILHQIGIPYKIFSYRHRYSEQDYLEYLQNSKFGIWVDAHESQGFALEEALACNVPLFVWNIKSMNQEFGQSYDDVPATTIPYWDSRCGEYFYDMNDFEEKFRLFLHNINNNTYEPREYVLENLSPEVCEKKLIELVMSIKNK